MITAIESQKPILDVPALRQSKNNEREEKINQVALKGLEDIVITIYQNTAQISDFFSAEILNSKTELIYQPLLPGMDPSSPYVHIDKGSGFIQSYKIDNDTFSMQNFFGSLVGKEVKMYDRDGNMIRGKVIEWGHNTITLYDTANTEIKFYDREDIKRIECGDLEAKMAVEPSLKANYLTEASSEELQGQVISLNRNFNWKTNYRLMVEETVGGLVGTLTADAEISNNSKKDLKDVVVKVVSGNLNMHIPTPFPRENFYQCKAMPCMSDGNAQTAAIDQKWQDLKAYLIPYKMDLMANETVSTRLFDSKDVKLEKCHVLHSYENQTGERHPQVCYRIENTEENNLSQAFPDGRVNVYRKEEGSVDLIGQHQLEKTPKGKDLKVITSDSFDLLAKKSVEATNIKDIFQSTVGHECVVKIELTNGSDEDQTVFLHEHFSKNSTFIKTDYTKVQKEGEEVVFEVKVPKNTTAKNPVVISYQYRKDFK